MLIQRLLEHLKELDRQADEIGAQIEAWHRDSDFSRRLAKIPGIGALTASALVATVGEARSSASGRQLAAWLGLVPGQNSGGGKNVLLGISKRGDVYLRTLLIHGARAVIYRSKLKNAMSRWLQTLRGRRNVNVAAVALANKNARIVWALLTQQRDFDPEHVPTAARSTVQA